MATRSPGAAPDAPRWRHFAFGEIEAALAWAADGQVAVHETGQPFRQWSHTCHLFARDEAALRAAARQVRCDTRWIQRRRDRTTGRLAGRYTTHYDLFGAPLEAALARCRADAARPAPVAQLDLLGA